MTFCYFTQRLRISDVLRSVAEQNMGERRQERARYTLLYDVIKFSER